MSLLKSTSLILNRMIPISRKLSIYFDKNVKFQVNFKHHASDLTFFNTSNSIKMNFFRASRPFLNISENVSVRKHTLSKKNYIHTFVIRKQNVYMSKDIEIRYTKEENVNYLHL